MDGIEEVFRVLRPLSTFAPFIMEFIGTFFLCLAVCVSGNPFAVGFTLTVCIYAGGHVSGANYNPAVTLTLFLSGRNKITLPHAIVYMIVQVVGGFAGGAIAWGIHGSSGVGGPMPSVHHGQALLGEFIWTFLLCFVVLNTATVKSQKGNSFFGMAIGFTVTAGAFAIGPISGGAFNPAVGTGPVILHAAYLSSGMGANSMGFGEAMTAMWIYWVGPMLGGVAAALVFRVTSFKGEYDKRKYVMEYKPGMTDKNIDLSTQTLEIQ